MNTDTLKEKLDKFIDEQRGREQQVAQWQEQIDKLTGAIRQTKEVHDYVRGQISIIEELLKEEQNNKGGE